MTETRHKASDDSLETSVLIRELQRPEAFPHSVDGVRLLQTHISLLFFAGQRVYKVKKPVDLGFLDFTSLERRRHFCEEEVRLNRRLAPSVYCGVVPITRTSDGQLRIAGEGPAVEWAVEMVRLPDHRMLSSLLDRGEIDNEQINSMVSLLAEFHGKSPTGPGVDEHGSPAAIRCNVEENLQALNRFVAPHGRAPEESTRVLSRRQHAFLLGQADRYLGTNTELFERRVREGRIREGHGDLHAGNICFREGEIVVYDCIEFNRRFRCGDVAAELAFLAMDLDDRGYPGFSKYLVMRYAKEAGDDALPALENFYKGYRALVRGKVAALTAEDPVIEPSRREELRREAMRYVHLATAYELPPAMILMCGLPGCGKSWLAKRLARSLRAAVLHSDVRRKVLAGMLPTTHAPEDYDSGLYSPENKDKTYRSLLHDAIDGLHAGHSVIVDASFSRRKYRSLFVDAAARLGLPYYVVHVQATERVVRERLKRRANEPRAISDAGLDVYLNARASFEQPIEVPQEHVLQAVSGEGIPEEQSSILLDRMIALQTGR